MPITLTDAEQAFADSPKGQMLLARARNTFETSECHKGANARPWTDAMEATAVRTLAMQEARDAVNTAALLADSARRAPEAEAARQRAHEAHKDQIRNGWRNPQNGGRR